MSSFTTISWATRCWNPTLGCTRDEDPGCDNCYAMYVAHRGMCEAHRGLTILRPPTAPRPGVDWNGKVRSLADRLDEPERWRQPERVFVNSMSDLFHHRVTDGFIARVWRQMRKCERHTFLVLTKRVARAASFSDAWDVNDWTLPNVHLGFSASCQPMWDKKAPLFEPAQAAVRWASLEPLLGPIDLRAHLHTLDWVVVGGESGSRSRPCNVAWIRDIVRQCRDAAVPVFVKQLGARPMMRADSVGGRLAGDHPEREWPEGTRFTTAPGHMGTEWQGRWVRLEDRKGEDMDEWPIELRIRQYPRTAA